jgi:hypothetical protein
MARTKAVVSAGARLSDYLSASLLARVYPVERVQQILDEHEVNSQRIRSFPAVTDAYYCMALSLYPEAAYEDVFSVVAQGLAWMNPKHGVAPKSLFTLRRNTHGSTPEQLEAQIKREIVKYAEVIGKGDIKLR